MPIYEYRCQACGKKFSALVGMTAEPDDEKCPYCRAAQISRLVSRVAKYRNEDGRVEEMADRLNAMDDPDSPQEMRSMMREMGKALDEDVSDEMEELLEADLDGEATGLEPD
jgi:putative FmdB family regulatory protein